MRCARVRSYFTPSHTLPPLCAMCPMRCACVCVYPTPPPLPYHSVRKVPDAVRPCALRVSHCGAWANLTRMHRPRPHHRPRVEVLQQAQGSRAFCRNRCRTPVWCMYSGYARTPQR